MGDCGAARFIQVGKKLPPGFQCPISFSPTLEKVPSCLWQGQDEGLWPQLLLHIEVQSSPPSSNLSICFQQQSIQFRLLPGACMWTCTAMGHMAARATCPLREETSIPCKCRSQVRERNRERKLICSPWVITRSLGVGRTRCFLKMTNQLSKLWWALLCPPPSQTDRPIRSSTSLCVAQQSGTGAGREVCQFPWWSTMLSSLGV